MKKELVALAALAVLTLAAVLLANPTLPTDAKEPVEAEVAAFGPYEPGTRPVVLRYRHEGAFSTLELIEIECRRAADGRIACDVLYKTRGGATNPVKKAYGLGPSEFTNALKLFERIDFYEVEAAPRSHYVADLGKTIVALSVGDRSHEVTIDGRHRASRDLGPILAFFDGLRRAATPEAVASGD